MTARVHVDDLVAERPLRWRAQGVKVFIPDSKPDSVGDTFDPAGVVISEDEVRVTYDFSPNAHAVIGRARLYRGDDGAIYADITVRNEPHSALHPAIGGKVHDRQGELVTKCELTDVALCLNKNVDPRIGSLGEQGVKWEAVS